MRRQKKRLYYDEKNNIYCDWKIEYQFNKSLEILRDIKLHDYAEYTQCPIASPSQLTASLSASLLMPNVAEDDWIWRPPGYAPIIFGNHCEPKWNRDIIFILSRLLKYNMKGIEYGMGSSTIWLSNYIGFLISIEHNEALVKIFHNITQKMHVNNVDLRRFNLGKRYVEVPILQNYENFDWTLETGNGVDFVAIGGRLGQACMNYAKKIIKPHGGIIVLDNGDHLGSDVHNASANIPSHWLRFESNVFSQHLTDINRRWIDSTKTTIWITRNKNCMHKTNVFAFQTFNN